jgi:hypothetical protein
MLPIRTGDSFCFMPTVVNYASGKGMINSGYTEWDPEGIGRLVWHGYLTSLMYGSLPWNSSYRGVFATQAIVASLVVTLFVGLYLILLKRLFRAPWWFADCCVALIVVGLLPSLLTGRHEPLATLVLLSAVYGLVLLPAKHDALVCTVGIALVAITAPAVGILASIAALVYIAWHYPFAMAVRKLIFVAVLTTCLVIALTEALYPYGFQVWMRAMVSCASRGLGYMDASKVYYWFLNPSAFMYGVWVVGSVVCGVYMMNQRWSQMRWPLGVLAGIAVFVMIAWRFGIWVSARNYNLFPFIPLACLVIVFATLEFKENKYAYAVMFSMSIVASLPAIGTARLAMHCLFPSTDVLTYQEAKRLVLREMNSEDVLLDTRLFSLVESQVGYGYHRGLADPLIRKAQVVILGQAKSSLLEPPKIDGFGIVCDRFSRKSPALFGIPIANTPEGYNLAIYRRVEK